MNTIKKPILITVCSTILTIGTTNAQVDVDLIIEFPEFAVLEYLSEVTVDIEGGDLGDALFSTASSTADAGEANSIDDGSETLEVTFDTDSLDGDETTGATVMGTGTAPSSINAIGLELPVTWAIRSNAAGDVTASAATGSTLTGPDGATIDLSSISVVDGDFAATGFAVANREFGGVSMSLDLTDATTAGTYENTTNASYTLSVAFD
ncbi:MAG: hypothetical protein AAF065_11805 [Verrucomicrobiota bacterium]